MPLANRRNRYTRLRLTALWLAAAAIMLLAACTDERIDTPADGDCEEGLPATVRLSLDIDGAAAVSRDDMPDGLDRAVTSLWLGIYNATTGLRTGTISFSNLNHNDVHVLHDVQIETLSGMSYIVGVANYSHRYAITDNSGDIVSMEQALTQADTYEKFCNISASFDNKGGVNIDAPINALLMSGHYTDDTHTDGRLPAPAPVRIAPGMSTPPGAVHLRRLISQVHFNISYNTDNIENFDIVSWHVDALPASSWLAERPDDAADPINAPDVRPAAGTRFVSSPYLTDVVKSGNTVAFDFWQLENRRTGLTPGAGYNNDNAYTYRQKEYKAADGSNTGIYCALVSSPDAADLSNNNATRVSITVNMRMKVDEDGKPLSNRDDVQTRLVEAVYTVHLGYCEGADKLQKATDFRCRRNTHYTYNVTINNISDIIVEANSGDATGERNPAVEGFVTDISGELYEIDAHYAAMNVYLTQDNINDFQYYITAPKLDGTEAVINSMRPASVPDEGSADRRYLTWVELRKTTGQNTLAAYKPASDSGTYLLPEIKGNTQLTPGWYTLFINEYVYEDDADETGSDNWHHYVNVPDRKVWLNVSGQVSPDGQSIYYRSKYAVSQTSIQTYYNDGSDSGLGVEHANETYGLNLRNTFNPHHNSSGTVLNKNTTPGRNANSGRFNLAQYLVGSSGTSLSWTDDNRRWSTYVDQTASQSVNAINNQSITRAAATHPLPAVNLLPSGSEYSISGVSGYDPDQTTNPKYVEAIATCLGRNRDLDGDGRISADEIRWFVPTTAQIVRIVLGRRALEHPLFDPKDITQLKSTQNGLNSSMLMYSSDGKMVWLMEGLSQSQWREWPASCAAPWDVRCVRNLGGNLTVINTTNVTTPAYQRRPGTNIVDLLYYDPTAIRQEAYHDAARPMPVHQINDQRYNRCYKSFEVFDSIIGLNDPRLGLTGKTIEWADYLSSNNPCRVLDYTGKTGWRVPNQKELTIIGILNMHDLNALSDNTFQVSCSYSYFDNKGYAPGSNPDDPDGTVSSHYRYPMKIITSTGQATQSELMNSVTVSNNYYGVRCVRDVE